MNIYDFAGNEWKWTLESTGISNYPCTIRGGYYVFSGSYSPASYRLGNGKTYSCDGFLSIGFRSTFYAN